MLMRRFALLCLALAATLVAHSASAEQRWPWPSDVFNAKPRANVAGEFDYYTLVLSWSPTHCLDSETGRDELQCERSDGMRYGFVLHGLWPQYEKDFPMSCRTRWKPFVPETVIRDMLDIMPSRGLVIHEYKAHGSCSGLTPNDYYQLSRMLFSRVRIPNRYLNPMEPQFVSPGDVVREFVEANPGLRPDMISVGCAGAGNRLRDVRICMTRDGRPRACGENERQGNLCRSRRMYVPPVRSRWHSDRMPPKAKSEPAVRPRVIPF